MIILSNKGHELMIYNNFIYRKKRVGQENVLWQCTKSTCNSIAYLCLNYQEQFQNFRVVRDHNHNPPIVEIQKKLYLNEMKKVIKLTNNAPRSIVNAVLRGSEASVITSVGKKENIYKNLRNYRRLIINPKPYIYKTIKLSQKLSQTHTLQKFYRFGPDNLNGIEFSNDILIFYSDSQIENLKVNTLWSVDGTFQVVPKPWFQLFTISYIVNNQIMPSIFVILKNKKQSTYEKMFFIIKTLNSELTPNTIISDFEYASLKAIKNSFLNANLKCCQFHLGQSIIRKVKELNLYYDYLNNMNTRKFIRSLIGLTYVDVNYIRNTFLELKNHFDFPLTLNTLYSYFYKTYIGDLNEIVRFPISLWHLGNNFDVATPKTNNGIEGWHNTFKNTFGTSIYSFELLILKLKDEEEAIRQKRIRINYGEEQIRKRRYVRMEEELNNFLNSSEVCYGSDFVFLLINRLFY